MKYVLDTHTHTLVSGHAYNTINEMARSAAEKGLELLAITEHGPKMPGSCQQIYFENMRVLRREKYGIRVLYGCELNIMNAQGDIDLPESSLRQLDIGIASIHPPCFKGGSIEENTQAYLNVMKNPWVHIIGHPDDGRFPVDYVALVQAAKENHVLLEINNSSLNPNGYRANARENDLKMLELCMKYQTPVVLGSDAHTEEDVANFTRAKEVLRQCEFPEELVVNHSVAMLESFLDQKSKLSSLS